MTEVLLDTRTFIWALSNSAELSAEARGLLSRPEINKMLSLVSVWEMAIKIGTGKLKLPVSLESSLRTARGAGLKLVTIDLNPTLRVEALPWHHRDPFDRLLACQCLDLRLPLLSRDPIFDDYGVDRVW